MVLKHFHCSCFVCLYVGERVVQRDREGENE